MRIGGAVIVQPQAIESDKICQFRLPVLHKNNFGKHFEQSFYAVTLEVLDVEKDD